MKLGHSDFKKRDFNVKIEAHGFPAAWIAMQVSIIMKVAVVVIEPYITPTLSVGKVFFSFKSVTVARNIIIVVIIVSAAVICRIKRLTAYLA